MPTYDYACKACGHRFERMQDMSDRPVRTCPSCGKRQVERGIGGGSGLLFKGSGFYITDYRSQGYKDKAKADADAAKPPEPTKPQQPPKTPKTEGRPAAKSPETPAAKPPDKPAPKP